MRITTNTILKNKQEKNKFLLFGLIGAIGTLINTALLWLLTQAGLYYLVASAIATEVAIISNFLGNHYVTFRNDHNGESTFQKFLLFQGVSLTTIVGTIVILWTLTTLFGVGLLLVWNLIAILVMFLANFILNRTITWKNNSCMTVSTNANKKMLFRKKTKKSTTSEGDFVPLSEVLKTTGIIKMITFLAVSLFGILMFSSFAQAELAATSQMGYHPLAQKQVVVYTSTETGTFSIYQNNDLVYGPENLAPATRGNTQTTVNCQGNSPCLVGAFSDLQQEGTYEVRVQLGNGNSVNSYTFDISEDIYEDNVGTFTEFFEATKQQGSAYHADMHGVQQPTMTIMADGSFLLVADQAALTTVRLGSAYRMNPELFQNSGADFEEYVSLYINYLQSLEGITIDESDSGSANNPAVRLSAHVEPTNAFVPGQTDVETIDVYIPGNPPQLLTTLPVTSLCGDFEGAEYTECVDYAAQYYKCQEDEVCLNMEYVNEKGTISQQNGNYEVSRGWAYDFGCYFDVNIDQGNFNSDANPCMVFDSGADDGHYTVLALAAYTQAYPMIADSSLSEGAALLDHAEEMYAFIDDEYSVGEMTAEDKSWLGMSLFLLYDYTGDVSYLEAAHALRGSIATSFDSYSTHGNEYYWEEYIRHEEAIIAAGLTYPVSGSDPRSFLVGKMFFDWENNDLTDMARNAERVFEKYRSTNFQNSRPMLIEGLYAAKTLSLTAGDSSSVTAPDFVQTITDNQLAWMTGMNGVQAGTGANSLLRSYSFIVGIGNKNPDVIHSRFFIDSGYASQSNGEIKGIRGTSLQFFDGEEYVYFDGKTQVLETKLGSSGNNWRGEQSVDLWKDSISFANGQDTIPGWINGAFDSSFEQDVIFNYDDTVEAYEYTETTNELVAVAVELFAYQDAIYNDRAPHESVAIVGDFAGAIGDANDTEPTAGNSTNSTIGTNTTDTNTSNTNATGGNTTNTNSTGNNETNSTVSPKNAPQIMIVSRSTTLKNISDMNDSQITYQLYEIDTGNFTVSTNDTGNVSWYIDGKLVETTQGMSHEFTWTPGIFATSNSQAFTVKAQTNMMSETWQVIVINVINPYYEQTNNDEQPITHVITNDNYAVYNTVVVGVTNGATTNEYNFSGTNFSGETDWTATITVSEGHNNLTSITVVDNETRTEQVYVLAGYERVYYLNPDGAIVDNNGGSGSSNSGSNSDETAGRTGGRGGSGGGGAFFTETEELEPTEPELVYVTFDKDVIAPGNAQIIKLDAKVERDTIQSVRVYITDPEGSQQSYAMELTNGDAQYGTWEVALSDLSLMGEYTIDLIRIVAEENSVNERVMGRSFYVADSLTSDEEFGLVFAIIDQQEINPGTEFTVSVDVRDTEGISSVTATLINSNEERFEIGLQLFDGDGNYGSWKGSMIASIPDSTYRLTSVTLTREDGVEQLRSISDRSVYVLPTEDLEAVANSSGNLLTGGVTGFVLGLPKIFNKPLIPTIIALTLGVIVIFALGVFRSSKVPEY